MACLRIMLNILTMMFCVCIIENFPVVLGSQMASLGARMLLVWPAEYIRI